MESSTVYPMHEQMTQLCNDMHAMQEDVKHLGRRVKSFLDTIPNTSEVADEIFFASKIGQQDPHQPAQILREICVLAKTELSPGTKQEELTRFKENLEILENTYLIFLRTVIIGFKCVIANYESRDLYDDSQKIKASRETFLDNFNNFKADHGL